MFPISDVQQVLACCLSAALSVCWLILALIRFRQSRLNRAYGGMLISISFGIITYRNIFGFSYMLTYYANLLQLAAVIIFIVVAIVLGNNK